MAVIMYIFLGIVIFQFAVLVGCAVVHLRRQQVTTETEAPPERHVVLIPCYGEEEDQIRTSMESIEETNYDNDTLLMLFVVDGMVRGKGASKTTAEIVLVDVMHHPDVATIEDITDPPYAYDYECAINHHHLPKNRVSVFHGTSPRGVPYMVLVKIGLSSDERAQGNRGKKDSIVLAMQLLRAAMTITDIMVSGHVADIHRLIVAAPMDLSLYTHMMIIDADTAVEPHCFTIFQREFHADPELLGMCGETRVIPSWNMLVMAQKYEYWYSHILLKSFEDTMFNVFVLSGCFSVYRLSDLLHPHILSSFSTRCPSFGDEYTLRIANILEIGEDRFLSMLLMRLYPEKRLGYTAKTHCWTNVPETLRTLLCQRRRWTNSLIHCHHHLFSHPPDTRILRKIRLWYAIVAELWTVYILPPAIVIGLLLFGLGFLNFQVTAWFIVLLILGLFQSLAFAILFLRLDLVPYWPAFFVTIPIFSFFVPLYSIWKSDALQWGRTRRLAKTPDVGRKWYATI